VKGHRFTPFVHPGRTELRSVEGSWAGSFQAMASPCEVLVDSDDPAEARRALELARAEALRIERKFSRYRDDNLLHRIHRAGGAPVEVDEETGLLLDYAAACHEMSGGMFDITSGVLRRVWTFDGSDRVPAPEAIQEALRNVGWERVEWRKPILTLPAGMEIDFGGIGKEYAVDRAAAQVAAETRAAFLVNFGGDLSASGPRRGERPWIVGLDDPTHTGESTLGRVNLWRGGLATSGDARRFVTWKGRRLGHILDPRTGWPVEDAPRSVTVLARNCLEAGTLSTLACLQGAKAREFLEAQGVEFWIP
jgi:thiamine biosynthesis lipoprotein